MFIGLDGEKEEVGRYPGMIYDVWNIDTCIIFLFTLQLPPMSDVLFFFLL